MKIKVVELADISITYVSLSLPKAKTVVLSRNTSTNPTIVKELWHINYPCGAVDVSISLKLLTKWFKTQEIRALPLMIL